MQGTKYKLCFTFSHISWNICNISHIEIIFHFNKFDTGTYILVQLIHIANARLYKYYTIQQFLTNEHKVTNLCQALQSFIPVDFNLWLCSDQPKTARLSARILLLLCEMACYQIHNDISRSDNLLLFLRDLLLRKVISIKISLHGSYLNKYRHKVHKNCLLISFTFIHWRFSLPFLLEAEKISGKNQLTFSIKRHHKDIYFRHICRKNLILISTKTFITVCFNLILMWHLINVILNCINIDKKYTKTAYWYPLHSFTGDFHCHFYLRQKRYQVKIN